MQRDGESPRRNKEEQASVRTSRIYGRLALKTICHVLPREEWPDCAILSRNHHLQHSRLTVESSMDQPGADTTHLTWGNVGLAFSFIVFNTLISTTYGLGVGSSLLTAAIRCVVQLSVVALVLQKVFEANNPWAVAAIAGAVPLSLSACSCILI